MWLVKVPTVQSMKFKQGDFVLRKRKCDKKDWFLCHPISFGQVIEYRTETIKTRPNVAHLEGPNEWEEILVLPFAKEMAPISGNGWIQWTEVEMVKVSRWFYCLLGLSWPLLRLTCTKPLDGRVTDW